MDYHCIHAHHGHGGHYHAPSINPEYVLMRDGHPVNYYDNVSIDGFNKVLNTAQYKGSSYANALRVERGITLAQAAEIAQNDPEIDYFVYVKGMGMILEIPDDTLPESDPLNLITRIEFQDDRGEIREGYCRVFYYGDTVFFKKEGEQMGSALDLADTYYKQ